MIPALARFVDELHADPRFEPSANVVERGRPCVLFLQYFRNPMYPSVYILEMAFHPIALGGHYVLWRSALQERVDVVERSLNAAVHKLEPLNRNRAAPKHEIMAGLQKARNAVHSCVVIIKANRLFRRRHLRGTNHLALAQNRFDGHLRDMFPDFCGRLAAVVAWL
jgi:hypothetical protein